MAIFLEIHFSKKGAPNHHSITNHRLFCPFKKQVIENNFHLLLCKYEATVAMERQKQDNPMKRD